MKGKSERWIIDGAGTYNKPRRWVGADKFATLNPLHPLGVKKTPGTYTTSLVFLFLAFDGWDGVSRFR
ncbi:MAG: hypothetical protein M3247_07745 [Thermoproteota archaeon]|nr:hypothetical protein [Thermoproteota archaeon]